jgi:hypothetical protein
MIGKSELALLLAGDAVKGTSLKLRPCNVAKAMGLSESATKIRINNSAVKTEGN